MAIMERSTHMLNRVVAAAFILVSLLAPARGAEVSDERFRQFVFFSVLQGLYETSLPDDVVERIAKVDPDAQLPISFLEGCPVCQPVYDAFKLYRQRPALWNLGDGRRRDFGAVLPADQLAALSHEDPLHRTEAVGRMVRGFIARSVEQAGWSAEERAAWEKKFAAAADQGEAQLRRLQARGKSPAAYQAMWSCMVCDGANKGCRRQR